MNALKRLPKQVQPQVTLGKAPDRAIPALMKVCFSSVFLRVLRGKCLWFSRSPDLCCSPRLRGTLLPFLCVPSCPPWVNVFGFPNLPIFAVLRVAAFSAVRFCLSSVFLRVLCGKNLGCFRPHPPLFLLLLLQKKILTQILPCATLGPPKPNPKPNPKQAEGRNASPST
jgi:hypothetical protein